MNLCVLDGFSSSAGLSEYLIRDSTVWLDALISNSLRGHTMLQERAQIQDEEIRNLKELVVMLQESVDHNTKAVTAASTSRNTPYTGKSSPISHHGNASHNGIAADLMEAADMLKVVPQKAILSQGSPDTKLSFPRPRSKTCPHFSPVCYVLTLSPPYTARASKRSFCRREGACERLRTGRGAQDTHKGPCIFRLTSSATFRVRKPSQPASRPSPSSQLRDRGCATEQWQRWCRIGL